MVDVFKVVNWLRVKNNADVRTNPNAEVLTQMKAMKLLYYFQAASLATTGKRLFNNRIVAWKYGPVIEAVHAKYAGQREIVGKITAADLADYRELQQDPQLRDLLNSVYDVYGHVSAIDLMNQTHRERPWKETPQSGVISDEAIRSYYQGRFVLDEN